MGRMLVRNLDDAVIEALRRRAAASGTSTEEEARRALAAAVGLDRQAASQRLLEMSRRIGTLEGVSTLDYLRRDRDTAGVETPNVAPKDARDQE